MHDVNAAESVSEPAPVGSTHGAHEERDEASGAPVPETLCEVSGWQRDVVAAACKPGQKVLFAPSRWGNEQLPVVFAALNCDLRYSIVSTNGAVTCIYGPVGSPEATAEEVPTSSSEPVNEPKDVPASVKEQ